MIVLIVTQLTCREYIEQRSARRLAAWKEGIQISMGWYDGSNDLYWDSREITLELEAPLEDL